MAVLAVRKTTWDGLSSRNKEIVRAVGDTLDLGVPALWETPATVKWYLFSDVRFRLVEVAYLGCLVANLGDIPGGYTLPATRAELRADTINFCQNIATTPVMWPVTIADDDPNRWQTVLDAQNTPAALQMADHPPATWSPVEVV